ncbi:MAG: hypothetical protein JW768_00485 [Chitinispirillaceae bacterium]|nr:hypothetical protein [Chitinispirillaceae bacterium]
MMKNLLPFPLLTGLLFCSCYQGERVSLTIDFSQAHTWKYMFGVDITGKASATDSARDFSSSIRTYLTGERTPHDAGAVRFKTGQTMIKSNFMSETERTHLERQCEDIVLYFSPREGALLPVDTTTTPLFNFGGWDLFRSFARVLPVLPESPMSVGNSWERERTIPIETSAGNALGYLFQSFILDSVTMVDSSRIAALSWQFTYRIQPDSIGVLDSLPLRGSGSGHAMIDLTNRRMVKAHAFFEVPDKKGAPTSASWQETAHVELVN